MATGVRWSRRALTAVLTLTLMGCNADADSMSPTQIASDLPIQSETQPSAAEPSASPPRPIDVDWIPIPVADATYSAVTGVAEWNDGLLAFGRDDRTHGGIWLSEDGINWEAAAVPDSPAGMVVYVADIVRVGDRYLAFGTTANPEGSGPTGAVLWNSADGRAWTEFSSDIPGGLLALNGQTILLKSQYEIPTVDDMYISQDAGSSWSAVPSPDPWYIGAAITRGGSYLLGGAVLTQSMLDDSASAAIWTSRDGTNWGSRTDLEGKLISGFATLPDGTLVALGLSELSGDDVGRVWLSADGVAWSQVAHIGRCCIDNLASTPAGIVGIGYDPGAPSAGLVATSRDGRSWTITRGTVGGTHADVVDTERFGIVVAGFDPDGRPAVILNWPFGP